MCWMHRWIIVSQSHLILFDTDLYGIYRMFFFCRSQWWRSPGKRGSLFHPDSDLFLPNEKGDVTVSTVCWSTMLAFLLVSVWIAGPVLVLKLYGVPYVVSVHENSIYLCLFKRLLWSLCIVCLRVFVCRSLSRGWILWLTCITMVIMRSSLGIAERYFDSWYCHNS